ncbi:hypothetical protein Tco_0986453 [Tanacetum coccineum]
MSATSSKHAEILAIHEASRECVWLRSVIQHIHESCEISSGQEALTVVHEDNAACIVQLKDGYIKDDRTKHILLKSGVTTRIPEKLLGDEGLCSEVTKLNSIFITVEVTFIKLKQPTADALKKVKKVGRPEHNWGKARRERSKSRRKRSRHEETSSDSEYEEGSDDACEDLNSPYKRPKPTPFTQRITHFKYHKRAKLPQNIRVYEGNIDPKDHLGGAARNWFDDLDPKSVDSFEELSQKFLEEFSQKKDMLKTPQKFTASRGGRMRAYKLSWTGSSLKVLT